MTDGPTVGSLFTGYGGLDSAVTQVTGGRVVWTSDVDPGACKVIAHRYPDAPNLGDITAIDWASVESVDVLCGGFPCTDVSAAGKRAGLHHGTRSGLWHEFARAIDELRPSLVVIENVRGLFTARGDEPTTAHLSAENTARAAAQLLRWLNTTHRIAVTKGHTHAARRIAARRGRIMGCRKRALGRARRHERALVRAIGTVLGTLAGLGYDAEWCGLRAADVGACHGRYRIFLTASPAGNPYRVDRNGWGAFEQPRQAGPAPRLLPTSRTSDTNGAGAHGSGGIDLRTAVSLLPTPTARDYKGANQRGDDTCLTGALLPTPTALRYGNNQSASPNAAVRPSLDSLGQGCLWGDYAEAVHRQERAFGRPAPEPTEVGPKGGRRLSPRFPEWMQDLPDGWITDVPGITRQEALTLAGNGCVPQQAAAALTHMLSRTAGEI